METKNFNKDILKVWNLVEEFDLRETICDCFYNWRTDAYEYSDSSFFYFLYDLCNYDMICIRNMKIDVKESNHPDIAAIVKKYATAENIRKVYDRLYNR